jgi:DnaJ family protein C protein 9
MLCVCVQRTYRGSPEEAGHLKKYYEKLKGDMEMVFMFVILSDPEIDSHRFMDIVQAAVASGTFFLMYRSYKH